MREWQLQFLGWLSHRPKYFIAFVFLLGNTLALICERLIGPGNLVDPLAGSTPVENSYGCSAATRTKN